MKTYNDQELDALVAELQGLLDPAIEEAKQEFLAKGVVQGGSGDVKPKAGHMGKDEKLGDEMSAKAKSNKFPNFPVSKDEHVSTKVPPAMEVQAQKEGSKVPDPMKVMPQNMEGSRVPEPMQVHKDEKSMSASPASAVSAEGSASPVDSGSVSAPSADSAGSASMPSMGSASDSSGSSSSGSSSSSSSGSSSGSDEMGMGDMGSLQQAYGQLSDEDLQMHYQALKSALMQRMGPDQGMAPAAPAAPAAPPAMAPPPAESVPQPDAHKALTMSEKDNSEALTKAEAEIADLKKQFEGLLNVVETMAKPSRKAITSMAEFVAKTGSERQESAKPTLTKNQIHDKLSVKAQDRKLEKKDQDLITRYYLDGDVSVDEIAHLLKD